MWRTQKYALIILNANHTLWLTRIYRMYADNYIMFRSKDSKASWELANTVSHHPAAL